MGFFEPTAEAGPVAIPKGLSLNQEVQSPGFMKTLGAAWRMDAPIGAVMNRTEFAEAVPIDPKYSPWDEIKSSSYEQYWDRFAGARTVADTAAMKSQIDRENEDRRTLSAAGTPGMLMSFGASLLSPSTLIPGGAIIRGAKGVKIATTAAVVGASAAVATAVDETVLQEAQVTRTGLETGLAIGGSLILGGVLGSAVGALSAREFRLNSVKAVEAVGHQSTVTDGLRSIGAAENKRDLTLRREGLLKSIRNIPVLGQLMKTSPLLRTVLSDVDETRKASAMLAESPYQYRINEEGQSTLGGDVSVETRVKEREYNDLSNAYGGLNRAYAEYWADGPVSTVGRITQPITRAYSHLLGRSEKLTEAEFMDEVGRAMRRSDTHPIPQVQAAAQRLRSTIFDRIKDEAVEVGLFGPDMKVKFADSYFSRVYKTGVIARHLGDGTEKDMEAMLIREYSAERGVDGAPVDPAEIKQAARETVQSILGMKPGQHPYRAGMGSPTKERVLSLSDEVLEPWLESDASVIMGHYFRSLVPDIEITRAFGDLEMTKAIEAINDEAARKSARATNGKARTKIQAEARENIADLQAMRDRIRGTYGVPDNPDGFIVQGSRALRNVSFMGHLGGMTIAAIPDVAGVIGRVGIQGAFGASIDLVTNPKRLFRSITDTKDFGAASEWFLNSRAASLSDVFDPYARRTKLDLAGGWAANKFAKATGMTHWNIAWKSIGTAVIASRMGKAAEAVRTGAASANQLRLLSANGIEPFMAERIAKELEAHADKKGQIWMPNAGQWNDTDAFHAYRRAMVREMDIMVITPGQDIPLSFSKETGKFFLQFKRFGFSAYERILLAGLQRTDADMVAQFTTAVLLGGLVSNIRSQKPKEGVAFWEDALDRSGVAGWLMEPYNIGASTFGLSISGEPVSRYQARSAGAGLLGPSVDMTLGVMEASNAFSTGQASYRDARKLMRPIPGNNLPYLLGLFRKIEDAMVKATGAKPRPSS